MLYLLRRVIVVEDKELLTLDDISTCIFHKQWLIEGIGKLKPEVQAKVMLDSLRVGFGMEPMFGEDDTVACFTEMLSNRIVGQKNAYLDKVNMSKSGAGRKKKYKDEDIYRLSREGKTVTEIASELQCSESTIRHSAGYQHRKDDGFVF